MSKQEDHLMKYWLLNRPDRLRTFILDYYQGDYDDPKMFWNTFRHLWVDGEFTYNVKVLIHILIVIALVAKMSIKK